MLSAPKSGGDTGGASQVVAYERLSDPIKKLLDGLKAEHDGFGQANTARKDGKFVRREPVASEHPIVRVHPVRFCLRPAWQELRCADEWRCRLPSRRLYLSIRDSRDGSLD